MCYHPECYEANALAIRLWPMLKLLVMMLKKKLTQWKQRLPHTLPQTTDDLGTYCDWVIWANDLPDRGTTRQHIATMIMHLPNTRTWASPHYFANTVKKALANDAAYALIKKISTEAQGDARTIDAGIN